MQNLRPCVFALRLGLLSCQAVNQQTLFRLIPWPIALIDLELMIQDATDSFASNAGVAVESLNGASLTSLLRGAGDTVLDDIRASIGDGIERPVPLAEGAVLRVIPAAGEGALVCLLPSADRETSERLDTLSAALRSIKHDINNPLTGALGNINLLLRRNDWDEKTRKRLTTAEHEMKKIGQIVVRLADLVPTTR